MVDLAKTKTYHGGTEARRKPKSYRGLIRIDADWEIAKIAGIAKIAEIEKQSL
jgi:hypothetical protein